MAAEIDAAATAASGGALVKAAGVISTGALALAEIVEPHAALVLASLSGAVVTLVYRHERSAGAIVSTLVLGVLCGFYIGREAAHWFSVSQGFACFVSSVGSREIMRTLASGQMLALLARRAPERKP